jgi:hypothetical protein
MASSNSLTTSIAREAFRGDHPKVRNLHLEIENFLIVPDLHTRSLSTSTNSRHFSVLS